MPITSDLGGKNYVLGRGRVFIDRFAQSVVAAGITAASVGTGERYVGNTPEFSTSSSGEDLDHFDSDAGIRVKDASVQLQLDRTGSFTCDNIDKDNLAMLLLGDAATITQTAATGLTFQVTVKRGMFYQLGATPSLPSGVRLVASVTCGKGAGFSTSVSATGNFEVDETLGRVYILPNATDIPDDTLLQFTYNTVASTRTQIVSSSNSIYAAVRFVANNPTGINRDYYLPYVKIAPDGDYNLKGDDWQTMGFTFEILNKASNIQAIYVEERPVAS